MNLQIDLEVHADVLLALVTGTLSFDANFLGLKQICDEAMEKGLNRILIDMLNTDGVLTTVDRYRIGLKLVEYCTEHQFRPRLAVVGELPLVDGFGIRVAKNRGLVAEVFPNRAEAMGWLDAGPRRTAA